MCTLVNFTKMDKIITKSLFSFRRFDHKAFISITYRHYVIFFLLQEMQNQMKALNDKSNLPDFSEMLAGFFGGGSSAKKSKAKA